MVNSQSQLIVLLVVFSVGFIFGAALAWWLASRGRAEPSDPEQDALKELRQRFTERAALWQENASGKLFVRADGKMAASAQQFNETQKKFLNALLKDWLAWMGFPGSQPVTPAPASPPPESTPVAASAAFLTPSSVEEARLAAATGKSTGPLQTPASSGAPAVKPASEAPKSIVEQIDAILQEKLKTRPGLQKGVKLSEDRREGVVVWVGLERYAGVDAVTDPEVKALLREAVQDWERQNQLNKK